MKNLFLFLTFVFTLSQSIAGTWEVVCIKQGPARGFDSRSLKPGNSSKPLRALTPTGTTNPGNTVGYPIGARSIPTQANVAEQSDISGDMNFISLGFGGQIVLRHSEWFYNGPGNDFNVFETTWGDPKCRPLNSEQALIEVSEDGFNWVTPGVLKSGLGGVYNSCYNGSFDIAPLMKAQFVRITDRTNPDWKVGGDGVDAYDVDGITTNYSQGTGGNPANPVLCGYQQGVASQFATNSDGLNFPGRGIVAQRKDFTKANINEVGFPVSAFTNPGLRDSGPNAGVYNFWSIGFGGWACFQLPYTIFNLPGPDIYVFETTWNNQPCPNYNEKAWVSVSVDGINFSSEYLICKDALGISGTSPAVDLSVFGPGFSVINYIKFRDGSSPSDFGGGADSYDIDNIFLAQPQPSGFTVPFSCESTSNVRQNIPFGASTYMEGGVPEEMFPLEIVGSNVVSSKISFQATIAEEGGYNYSIRNSQGQLVNSGQLNGKLYDTPTQDVDVNSLSNGVYFLTLTSNGSKETVKFVKN